MDEVFITGLLARGIIGVYDYERNTPQPIVISVRLFADLRQAAATDDLAHSPDYGRLAESLKGHAERAARRTVEALAEDLAGLCLQEPGVRRVWVRVEKPQAVPGAASVGVEIERP
jgi:FolB domain-containing protein